MGKSLECLEYDCQTYSCERVHYYLREVDTANSYMSEINTTKRRCRQEQTGGRVVKDQSSTGGKERRI